MNYKLRTIKAFTLAEVIITVAILGILAALVIPQFQSHTAEAQEAAAKDNLRVLRSVIELYAAQHNGVPPGYPNGDMSALPTRMTFVYQLLKTTNQSGQIGTPGTAGYVFGPYLRTLPENPFNDGVSVTIIGNGEEFPAQAPGEAGWVYKPATKTIRLDWPGTDSEGVLYYDY